MATSNSYGFTCTANRLITLAAKMLGKLGANESITAAQYQDLLFFANAYFKTMQLDSDTAVGNKMYLRKRAYMFFSDVTGEYILGNVSSFNSTFTNAPGFAISTPPSYWTENFYVTYSGGNNAQGATTIHLENTASLVMNQQSNVSSQVTTIRPGDIIGIQMDNQTPTGTIFWTQVASVSGNTVTIPVGLPESSNNSSNIIYGFTVQAQPPQTILGVTLRDVNGNDSPVVPLTLEQYNMLPSKQASNNTVANAGYAGPTYIGDPIAYYYESHLVGSDKYGIMYTDVDGAEDLTKYFSVSYLVEIQDLVNLNDELDFPQEWLMGMVLCLAKLIAPYFNAEWTQTLEGNLMVVMRSAKKANPKRSAEGFQVYEIPRAFDSTTPWR